MHQQPTTTCSCPEGTRAGWASHSRNAVVPGQAIEILQPIVQQLQVLDVGIEQKGGAGVRFRETQVVVTEHQVVMGSLDDDARLTGRRLPAVALARPWAEIV